MNAGLSNLISLKRRLLLASDVAASTYDDAVKAVGLGVAGLLEATCDRKFERLTGQIHEISGNRTYVVVPRYPLESVASVQVRESAAAGWTTVDPSNYNFVGDAGLVTFLTHQTGAMGTLRVTYTGGFWWDTSEDFSMTKPTGATEIPAGLLQAWVMGCKAVWDRGSIDAHSKAGFTEQEIERFIGVEFELPKTVRDAVERFRRFA